ncbi:MULTISPECIES: NAD-dependent succinate-semialdehyde dehydrogenase [unclassified Achromobacter]|uniref:NAD-dependent succinate-semialdehyde dehydrogenase n=1 Tax=unclassified Achromobacter TaxID=2626865 RepID=UPI000B5180A6|nr:MULTISPECIES: NAD-dependent succinate-semialdehyde dehydrogenase [unclassified Achromobacter]OWT81108.1 succinate-semialdehyde dehydrogenase (NADP(+)) [Achromobacter sp. HZ34]OWT82609.1 succinate-semialdehyde dehydrogenase (NADP(+)) [Achromobacter sp. HZ28]
MTQKLQRPDLLRDACYIDGKWHSAGSGPSIPVTNPATGATIVAVPKLGRAETEHAIERARAALPGWAARPAKERAAVLLKWAQLMMQHQQDLATIMTSEQGKPVTEAAGEIAYAASFLEWFGEEAKRMDGEVLQSPKGGQRMMVLKQPIGVCAAITPWNFPAAMITRKLGPALAAGCTMIVKPAQQTPLTALALAVLAEEAGVPAGVIHVITGSSSDIGAALCESETVRKLSFTGSTEVGRKLMAQCAPTIKKLSLELGGNAPFLVFDDADLDKAVDGIIASKFRNAGQTCVCANRIYVQDGIYDELAARLVKKVQGFKVGDGFENGVTQGPLIDEHAVAKVREHIDDATKHGARVITGGEPHALGGTFFQPTVVRDVTQSMRFAQEETFGPVAPLFRFRTEEEALAMANDTIFGLAAYFFTRDNARVWRVSEGLEYGIVGINTGLISNEVGPFGGVKQSGLGREGSRHGLEEYVELKYLCIDIAE